ncbi:MAG: hypothetical protein H7123_08220 [Thermoleophilia bacterium]|nr:hypothetical protein [Thermoleophilia bacterium]
MRVSSQVVEQTAGVFERAARTIASTLEAPQGLIRDIAFKSADSQVSSGVRMLASSGLSHEGSPVMWTSGSTILKSFAEKFHSDGGSRVATLASNDWLFRATAHEAAEMGKGLRSLHTAQLHGLEVIPTGGKASFESAIGSLLPRLKQNDPDAIVQAHYLSEFVGAEDLTAKWGITVARNGRAAVPAGIGSNPAYQHFVARVDSGQTLGSHVYRYNPKSVGGL